MYTSLASPEFLTLGVIAALLLPALAGRARDLAFLALNLAFLLGVLLGPSRVAPALVLCVLGYALTRVVARAPRWGFIAGVGAYIAVFAYLRDYQFLHWILPEPLAPRILATVGLSFMFFKTLHVMIEARSGTLGGMRFVDYLNYTLNFTVFMMGPIQRFQDYRAQWTGQEEAIPASFESHLDAVLRILVGLVKAYVLAAALHPFILGPGTDVAAASRAELIGGIVAFYFFLYFNFSGYCDVVIGLGSLIGVRPPENFDKPFLARSITDFWLRFHRSLTQWLTTYVFSPAYKWALGHQRFGSKPLLAANAALLLTMIVSGVWHGTTLSFLLFGLVHGLYFVTFRTWEAWASRRFGKAWLRSWRERRLVHAASIAVTFAAVALSLVFFQLDAARAFDVFQRLVGL